MEGEAEDEGMLATESIWLGMGRRGLERWSLKDLEEPSRPGCHIIHGPKLRS